MSSRKEQRMLHCHGGNNKECYIVIEEITGNVTFIVIEERTRTVTLSLRSFHRFAVRSSSAHEGKIIIFEKFQCSLTKTIQLN